MNSKRVVEVLDNLVFDREGRHLDGVERIVICAAWDDVDYHEVAQQSSYNLDMLQRRVAPKLWVLLTGILGFGEKITKKRLRRILEPRLENNFKQSLEVELKQVCEAVEVKQVYEALPLQGGYPPSISENYGCTSELALLRESTSDFSFSPPQPKTPVSSSPILGDCPPNISEFYGRVVELASLKAAVSGYRCVVLFGAAGIGKSVLVAKLVQNINASDPLGFDCLLWKSIHYAPELPDLLDELLVLLADSAEVEVSSANTTQAKISLLIERLSKKRCLIVLDAADAILQGDRIHQNDICGYGKYAEYGVFFRRIIEGRHQSCILLTSRESFLDIAEMQGYGKATRSLQLGSLGDAGHEILRHRNLSDEETWGKLINDYRGNPLSLVKVADTIQNFYGGKVKLFFDEQTTVIPEFIQRRLNHLFLESERLTNLEKQIVIYLAENIKTEFDSVSFLTLVNSLKSKGVTDSVSGIIEALKDLSELSLVEKNKDTKDEVSFTLQPIVKKYILTDIKKVLPLAS